jgi:hypothetical protein
MITFSKFPELFYVLVVYLFPLIDFAIIFTPQTMRKIIVADKTMAAPEAILT